MTTSDENAVQFQVEIEMSTVEGDWISIFAERAESRRAHIGDLRVSRPIAEALRARLTGPTAEEERARLLEFLNRKDAVFGANHEFIQHVIDFVQRRGDGK